MFGNLYVPYPVRLDCERSSPSLSCSLGARLKLSRMHNFINFVYLRLTFTSRRRPHVWLWFAIRRLSLRFLLHLQCTTQPQRILQKCTTQQQRVASLHTRYNAGAVKNLSEQTRRFQSAKLLLGYEHEEPEWSLRHSRALKVQANRNSILLEFCTRPRCPYKKTYPVGRSAASTKGGEAWIDMAMNP